MVSDLKKPTIYVRTRSKDEKEQLEKTVEAYREQFGDHENWKEIEVLMREDVDAPEYGTRLVSGYIREDEPEVGDHDAKLSTLKRKIKGEKPQYMTGLSKEQIKLFDPAIKAVFKRRQVKNIKLFESFLSCNSMVEIADKYRCSKQNIHNIFNKYGRRFVECREFISTVKDLWIRDFTVKELADNAPVSTILDPEDDENARMRDFISKQDRFRSTEEMMQYARDELKIDEFENRLKQGSDDLEARRKGVSEKFTPRGLKQMFSPYGKY